jgi:hypothetical protein
MNFKPSGTIIEWIRDVAFGKLGLWSIDGI